MFRFDGMVSIWYLRSVSEISSFFVEHEINKKKIKPSA